MIVLPLIYLIVFSALPIVLWLARSVLDPDLTLRNIDHLLEQPVYAKILGNTMRIAVSTTVICLLFGYPVAYYLVRLSSRARSILLVLVLLPFWTSVLVRSFAWLILLSDVGPVNHALLALGLVDEPVRLVHNSIGTLIGMSYVQIPYGILVMLGAMLGIDRNLMSAASTLGARPIQGFLRVFLPLSLPGVSASALLIFIESIGFFITPALLGGPEDTMLSQSVEQQINLTLNWGFAAVLALLLLITALIVYAVYARIGLEALFGTVGQDAGGGTVLTGERRPGRMRFAAGRAGGALSRMTSLVGSFLLDAAGAVGELRLVQRMGSRLMTGWAWLTLAFLAIPISVVIPMSFNPGVFLELPPRGFSLRWYELYLTSSVWQNATITSIVVGLQAAFLSAVLGTLAAFGITRLGPRFRPAAAAAILSPIVVPRMVIAIAAFYFYARLGLIGAGQVGLILTHTTLGIPFVTISVLSVLQGFDRRLEQAALTLGAGPFQTFRLVIFPLIRPGILSGALFAFITSFDDLIVALFLTGGAFRNLPKTMWEDILLNVRPTLAAIATILVVVTTALLLAATLLRRQAVGTEAR